MNTLTVGHRRAGLAALLHRITVTAPARRMAWFPLLAWLAAGAAIAQPSQDEPQYLDVSISLFDANVPPDPQAQRQRNIYPQVRQAEARYIPAFLRIKLIETGQWGVVRVIPEPDPEAELMITGTIVQSDGAALELAIAAVDGTGRPWLEQTYREEAREGVSLARPALVSDDFQHLYDRIVRDLAAFKDALPEGEIARVKSISLLRFGASLSPGSFTGFLNRDAEDHYAFSRLPAANDPMLRRIEEIRQHQYLFIDVVDEQYMTFFAGIKPVYDLWRGYRREQLENATAFEARETTARRQFPRGSYRALQDTYNNYRWAKMQDQYLDEIAAGFSNEIQSTEIDLEDTVYRLTGTLTDQYREWRSILAALLEVEDGG